MYAQHYSYWRMAYLLTCTVSHTQALGFKCLFAYANVSEGNISKSFKFIIYDSMGNLKYVLYVAMYNVHPWFWPKLSGKKSFVLIFNVIIYVFIVRYCFLYYKGILTFILDILWYKKFYVTNNYKIQEQIQGISGTTHI